MIKITEQDEKEEKATSNKNIDDKIQLQSQIWKTDLGLLEDNNSAIIIKAIKIMNGIIDTNLILLVQDITRNSAVITVGNDNQGLFEGTVIVTFIIRQQNVVDNNQPGPSGWKPPSNNLPQVTINQDSNPNIMLNVPNIQQLDPVWCGPAAAEAILRYNGLQTANPEDNNTPQTNYEFQNTLAQLMNTSSEIGGTNFLNLSSVMNRFISHFNLNNNRQYEYFNISDYTNR